MWVSVWALRDSNPQCVLLAKRPSCKPRAPFSREHFIDLRRKGIAISDIPQIIRLFFLKLCAKI